MPCGSSIEEPSVMYDYYNRLKEIAAVFIGVEPQNIDSMNLFMFIMIPISFLSIILWGLLRELWNQYQLHRIQNQGRERRQVVKKVSQLRGKHVCVTGGSSGIGKSVAIMAAKEGAHVTILARDAEKLNDTIDVLERNRVDFWQSFNAVSVDCAEYPLIKNVINTIDTNRPIHMFVNCVGMTICGRLEEMSNQDVDDLIDANYLATIYSLQVIVPRMKSRKEGFIVITGSLRSLSGMYGYSVYSSTKFAMRGLAEALHMELRDYNVGITLALPPDTNTPGYERSNESKPEETKILSKAAHLFDPHVVAKELINDTLRGNFISTVGVKSWFLTTLCVGMSPFNNFFQVICQTMVLGLFRLIGLFNLWKFHQVIAKFYKKRMEEHVVEPETDG